MYFKKRAVTIAVYVNPIALLMPTGRPKPLSLSIKMKQALTLKKKSLTNQTKLMNLKIYISLSKVMTIIKLLVIHQLHIE